MGIYTQALIKNRLSGKVASLMLILLLFVGVSHVSMAADYYYSATVCATPAGTVNTSYILAAAVDGGGNPIPEVHKDGNSDWHEVLPLFTVGNDEVTGAIGGYTVGSTVNDVEWRDHDSGNSYFIDINFTACAGITACAEGVLQLGNTFDDMVPVPVNGHRNKGYWSASPALTFTNVNDPNAIASGFELGTSYTITWHHQGGTDYILTVNVPSTAKVSDWSLENELGNTDDVVLCGKRNYDFTVPWDGDFFIENYDFWVTHDADGSSEVWAANVPGGFGATANIKTNQYENLDKVWAIITDDDNCQIQTNEITISDIAGTQVRVEGGASACQAAVHTLGLNLEVIPYDDATFTYRWYRDGALVATNQGTFPITQVGSYFVEVDGCGFTYTSNTVVVTENILPDALLVGGDICENPVGGSTTLSATFSGGNILAYDLSWLRNSTLDPLMGIGSTATTDAVGSYEIKMTSATDNQCWKLSNTHIVGTTSPLVDIYDAVQPAPCLTTYTPVIRRQLTGAALPYTLTLRESGQADRNITVNDNSDLTTSLGGSRSASTTIDLIQVTDANGCITSTPLPISANFTFVPHTAPTVLPISGTDVCSPATTTVSLVASESGVEYYLTHNGVEVVPASRQIGNSGILNWNVSAIGFYNLYAVDACGGPDVLMDNTVYIDQMPTSQNMTRITGAGCSNVTHVFGLDASEDGVTYTLYFNGAPHPTVAPQNGNVAGTAISFTGVTAPGLYQVYAQRRACEQYMTGSFTIVAAPITTGINIIGSNGCSNELKNIGISANEPGVTYDLILDGNIAAPVASIVGDGTAGTKYFYGANTTLAAGLYTVRVTALNGCEDWLAGSLTIFKEPDDLAFSVDGQVCGTGDVIIPIGEAGVTYTLYQGIPAVSTGLSLPGNGINPVAFNTLGPGYYTVYAEIGTCTRFLSDFLEVETQPLPQVVNVPDDNYCSNETGVDIIVAGSQAGFDYELYNTGTALVDQTITATDATGVTFANVTAGTYEVRVVNNSCNLILQTGILIVENAVTVPNANIPSSFCSDQGVQTLTGWPTVVAGSSTGLYTIIGGVGFDPGHTWDINAGTLTFDPANCAPNNIYTIHYEYTDGNGCVADDVGTTIVYDLAGGAITIDSDVPGTPCQDDPTPYELRGLLVGNSVGGTFTCSTPAALSNADVANGTVDFTPSDAGNGVHTVTFNYVDPVSGCAGSTTINITIGTPLNMVGFGTNYCSNEDIYITLNGNPAGGTFAIYEPGGVQIESGIPDGNNDKLNPKTYFDTYGAGTYQLVYTYNNAGCINTLTTDFQIVESLDAGFTFPLNGGVEQTTYCVNDANVLLSPNSNVAPANITSFFSGNGVAGSFFVPSDANVVYSPVPNPITHQLTNTVNGFTCTTSATRNVYVAEVDIAFSGLNNTYCENVGTSIISLNGADAATGTATFSSTNNSNPSLFITNNGDNTATLDPSVGPGVYEVQVDFIKAGDLCERTLIQSVTVLASTPVTFSGFNHGDNVCSSSAIINLLASPAVGAGTGNFILLGGGPGLDNGVADDGIATLDPSLMTPGTYTVRYEYTNADACDTEFEKDIIISDAPATTHTVTGGGAYCNDAATPGAVIGLGSATIGVQYELLLNNNPTVPAATYTPTTNAAFNFTDDNTTTGADRYFTATGTYTVRAVLAGCDAIMSGDVSVEQYELTLTTSNVTSVSCKDGNDGSITLLAGGGSGTYQYRMESPVLGAWTANPVFAGLEDGIHVFSVRDVSPSACEKINLLSVDVTEPALELTLSEDVSKRINVGCLPCTSPGTCEGSATLVITGGTPFTDLVTYPSGYDIRWPASANNQTSITAIELDADTYGVRVEDANGCVEFINITIVADNPLDVVEYDPATNHIDNVCFGASDGSFMVQASEGSGQYLFSIDGTNYYPSNHATDPTLHTFSGLTAGTYTVYLRDLVNPRCNFTIGTDVIITEPAAGLSLVETLNNQVTCFGGSDGSFTVQAFGGNGFYEFSSVNPSIAVPADWIDNGTNEFTVSGVIAGNHSVWVRDRDNPTCTGSTIVVNVGQVTQLTLTAPIVQNVTCHLGNDGQIELLGAGGSGNYVYSIDAGLNWQASNVFSTLTEGTYQFSIAESANPVGCNRLNILSVTLLQPVDFSISEVLASHVDVNCNGGNDGEFEVLAAGGVGLKQFRLHDGTNYITAWDANPLFSNLSEGTYEVSVRDRVSAAPVQWCEKDRILSVTITQPAAALVITSDLVTDATCFGTASGSISVTVAGGTPAYNYQWTHVATNTPVALADGGQSADAINLIAGDYRLDVTDANTVCTISNTYTVGESAEVKLSLASSQDPSCYGAVDGSITVNAIGGSGTYEYSYNGGAWVLGPAGTYTINAIGAGTYNIQVRDAALATCISTDVVSVNLLQPAELDLFASSITHLTCNGTGDGAITITGVGRAGVNDYDYYCQEIGTWQTSPDFTLLSAGTYHFKVRDRINTSCESALSGSVVVTEPVDFTTTATPTDITCNGANDGELSFVTLPVTGTYQYSLDGGPWLASPIKNLSPGTYGIRVQDVSNGCIKALPDEVINEPLAAISIDNSILTHVDCNGNANGTAEVVVSGGTPIYTYQWRNMSTGVDVPPAQNGDQAKAIDLPAGDYQVTITDANFCSLVSPLYIITEPVVLTTTYTVDHITVVGLTDGRIVVNNPPAGGTAPYTITWADGAAFDGLWLRDNLSQGTYTYTIEDANGCTFVQNVIVLANLALDVSVVPNSINCYAAQTGILAVNINGGTAPYDISWTGTIYDGSTDSGTDSNVATNYEIKPLYAGTYSVTVTDGNGISQTITNLVISQPNELVINQLVLDDISCNGAADGHIQVELAGHLPGDMANYNMSWTGPGGFAVAGLASAVSDQPNLVLPGDYTVTVNYNGTCAVAETYTIAEPSAINVLYTESHISAAGANDGQIVVVNPPTGGVPPYAITWADGAGAFDGMWTRTNLAPGSYDFTVTDEAGTGCSVTYTASIIDATALDFSYTVTPVNCYSEATGVIAMVISGGTAPFDLQWDAVLYDGSTDSGTGNAINTNHEIKNLIAGNYNVKVTDSNGAEITYPIVVSQPNELLINTVIQDDISCNGAADGHLQVSLSGHLPADMNNYTMTWTGPGGFSVSGLASAVSDQPNLVLPGNYTVTVNYNSTCNVTATLLVDEPSAIVATHTETHVSVAGASDGQIVVDNPPTGGLAPYAITWDDGAAYDGLWTRDNLSAGTYTYTITDANTCTFVQAVTILDVAALDFVVVPNTINCYAAQTGILAVTINGGQAPFDIAWSGTLYDGSTDSGTDANINTNYEIKPLYAGTYSVTITDNNGASLSLTNIVITQPNELVINQLVLDDISCNAAADGRIQVELVGHLPADMANYNMSWTGPGGFAVAGLASAVSDQTNLVLPGDYTVMVNYNGTCAVSETYTINEPSAISAIFTETHISSAGANDGQIVVTNPPTGGVSPYTIAWADGAGAFDGMWTRTLLAPGSYDFTITDNAGTGCSVSYTATILDVDALDYTFTVTDVNCYSDQTGTIALVVTGGTGPYDLQWDAVLFDGSTDSDASIGINTNHQITNLFAGTYNVKVTDSKGAEISYSIVVAQPGELLINNIVQDDISCAGAGDGHLQVTLSGHLPADMDNYTMTWTGPGGFSASGLASAVSDQPNLLLPGNYTVTVNYNGTCNVSETYVIAEPSPIIATETVTQISVVGANDGMIVVDNPPIGGVAPYTITWADGAAFDGLWTRDNLAPGSYTYTIRDNSATCSYSATLVIDELQALDYIVSANTINCYGANTGIISLIINSGQSQFNIEWDGTLYDGNTVTGNDTNIPTNYEIRDLFAGDYTIKITDGNGSELTKVIVVGQAEEVVITEGVNTQISCFGAADGSLQVNVTQGATDVSAYPIYWSGPGGFSLTGTVGANSTISNLALEGTYTVTVSYNGTCTVSENLVLTEPDELSINLVAAQTNDVSCNGGIDGQIGVSVTGGFGYSYQWAKWNGAAFADIAGETNPIITGIDAGRYRITATLLSTGCPVVLEHTIIEPDALTLTVAPIDIVTCNGDNTGELSLVIDGGVQPYRYNYGTGDVVLPIGQTNDVIENLSAGFYDVIVTDNNNCTISLTNNEISEPAALNVAVVTETISCEAGGAGWPDGELSIDISGGRVVVGSHFYMIALEPASSAAIVRSVSNLAGNTLNETFSGLLPDTYVLKVYDQNSQSADKCIYTYSFTLELINISGNELDATCEGVADGSITGVSVTGVSPTYTYTWSSPDGGLGFDPNTLDQDGLSVGTYRLTIDDTAGRGCIVSQDFVIAYGNEIVVDAVIYDVECFGDATGSITLDVAGVGAGVTYLWTGPGITPANENDKDLTALVAGDYTVQVSDAINAQMCYAVETFTVSQASEALDFDLRYLIKSCDPFVRTIEIFNLVGGTGNQDPASGDFKYNVSGPGVITVDPADYLRFDVDAGGTYTVKVTDKNDCTTSYDITIPVEMFIAPVVTDVKCSGGNTGAIAINLTGGSGSFSYAWTKTGDAGFSANTPNLSGLTTGEYVLTITDNIESDGTACTRTYAINVNEPQPIIISVDDKGDVTCNGDADGYVNLDIQGGVAPYTYSWNPAGGGIIQGDKNQSGLIGGTYTITVTDANLCTASQNVTILEPDVISGTLAITDTQCDGTNGAIVLTPTGGSGTYLYSWSTSDGDASNIVAGAKDQSALTGGTYTVVITDADPARSGCQTTLSATLTQAIDVINEVITDVTCSGNNDGSITFDVTGGDGNYSYTWSTTDGNPAYITPGVQNQNGLTAGTYTVVIRDGRVSGGTDCEITRSFTIEDATGLSVNVAIDHVKCNGASTGSLSAVVNGGSGNYSYDWNGGLYTTATINNVPAGIYTLVVEDLTLSCTYTNIYTIDQPADGININVVNITDNLCKDEALGEIEVLVTGGTAPYTYFWTGPSPATGTNPTNLLAGTYTLSITDDNGCVLTSGDIDVGEPATHISVTNPVVTNATAPGATDGEIAVTVTGGASPYTYEWYEQSDLATVVSTTNPATGLGSGTYNVIAYDQNSCSFEYTGIKVSEPGEALGFVETVHHISPCNGLDNGELTIVPFGGFKIDDLDYRIQITGPGGTNIDRRDTRVELTNLQPGVYSVIVDDASSPTVSRNITIEEYPPLAIVTTKVNDVNCYGASTGEINVVVTGGKPNASGYYLVEIISAEGYYNSKADAEENTAFSFTGLPVGNYTITVTDHASDFDTKAPNRGNCTASDVKLILQPVADVAISSEDGSSSICDGEDFNLALTTTNWDYTTQGDLTVTVYDGFTYTDVVVDASPFILTVAPNTSRNYQVTKVADPITSTCLKGTGSGLVALTVNSLATATITGPSEVCDGGEVQLSVTLTGTAPWSITWVDDNNGTTNTIPVINSSPYTFTDAPIADASYRISNVTDANTCDNAGVGVVNVVLNENPSVTLSGSQDICIGDNAVLALEFATNVIPYTITYEENGEEKVMGVSPNSGSTFNWTVTPSVTTTYEITNVVDANGCVMNLGTTIEAVVTVNQLPGDISTINSVDDVDGVCQSQSGVTYTIDAVSDADGGYVWTAPANSTIVSGNGTRAVTLNFDVNFTGGYLRVYATNSCGDGNIVERWIPAKLLPEAVGVITGASEFCQGTTGITFSVDPVPNATNYRWELPTGFIIQGDATAASILVNLDPMLDVITGEVKVTPYNACGDGPNTATHVVNVYPLPTAEAGTDDPSHCGSTYTLNAIDPTSIDPAWSGRWEVIAGAAVIANVNAHNSNVTNMSRGDVTFRWIVTNTASGVNACEVYDEVTIRNNTLSVTANAANTNVCNGSTNLSGTVISTANTTGRWEAVFPVGSTASFSTTSQANTVVTNMMPDRNVFRWTLTQNGCDSYGEVEVINNEPSDAIITQGASIAVCDNQVTLDAVPPVVGNGNGRWTLISGSGVIDSPNTPSTLITGLDYGDNVFRYTVDKNGCGKYADITVRNNTLQVDAGPDAAVCDGTLLLDATVPPSGVAGRWVVVEGAGTFDNGLSPTATVSGLDYGINRLVWELNQDGCISSDEIIITNNAPTEATVGSNQVLCSSSAVLSGNSPTLAGELGFWSIVSGSGEFDDVNDPITTVRNIQEGENVFSWTIINNGCRSSADITITNLHVYVNAGKDSVICGRTTTLKANTPDKGVGEWSVLPGVGGATISDQNDPNTLVGGLLNGPNGFIWKITYNTCESRDTVIINNNTPYPVNAGTDQIIFGGTTFMNATPVTGGVGRWSLVSGGGTIADASDPFTQVSGLRRGDNIFRWTVDNAGCTDFDDVIITNGETIDADAGLDQVICDDFTTLQGNDPDVGIPEWSVVSGSGKIETINGQKTRVYDLGPGDNVFRYTIYYTNSSSSDVVTITNNKVTRANAGPDREICGDSYQLEANIPAIPATGGATWSMISGSGIFVDANDPNTIVNGLAQGVNVLKYEIAQFGCNSVDTVRITNMLPTAAYAGEDEVICTDSIELRPNTPTFGIGEWRVSEGSADFEGNWAKNLAPGRNVLSWVITSGSCVSIDDVVIINNKPSTAFAGQDRIICVDNVTLSANTPQYGVGTWELISGSGVIADVNNPNTGVTGIGPGKNRFRWTIDNSGCISSDDVEIANNYIQSFAGYDQINCADTALLEANNPFPGEGIWGVVGGSGAAYFDEPNNPYSTVRDLDQGDNVLTWTITYNGCSSVSTITVTNNNPTTALAGPDQALCIENAVLAGNDPSVGTGSWSVRSGSGTFVDSNDPSTSVDNLAFGENIFRWTVINEGCRSIDDVQVSFNRIDAQVGPDQPVCSDEAILEANNASPGVGTWTIIGGSSQAVFDDQNNPNTTVRNLAQGDNRLLWTIINEGCETSAEVIVTNNLPDAAYAGNSQTICDDFTTLDATPVSIGVGRWEVLSGSGTITNINDPKTEVTGLSKENVFRWTVQNGICTLSDEVLVINNKPPEPYAGKDEELCTPQMRLKANPIDAYPGVSGLWTIESGAGNFDDPTDPSALVTNLSPGTNVLRWTLTQGQCTLMDEITIVNNAPTIANAGPDVEDCRDFSVLDANIPNYGTGSWTVVSGRGDFDDITDPKTTVRNLGFGENILMWSIQNGSCFSTDQIIVFNMVPDESAAGSDRSTCDDYIVLNANNPVSGTGLWTVISGSGEFENPTQHNTMVTNLGFGDNVFKWTISYGECITEDEVMISSNIAQPFAGEDDVTYEPEYAMQAANPGSALTGTWTVVAGGGTFDDVNFFNTTVRDLPVGKSTFRWTIETAGCSAFDEVTIDYKEVPEAGFTVDADEGCYPLTVRFTNYSVGGSVWSWEFGDGGISDSRNPNYTYTEPGRYTAILTVQGPDGNDAVYSEVITVHDHPIANFNVGPDVVYIPGEAVKCYDLSVDAVRWFWEFGDGSLSEERNPSYEYQDPGFYNITLRVESQFGCEDIYTLEDAVEAKMSGFVSFPDAFAPRPGGNGASGDIGERNDAIFKPKYRDVEEYHIQIFNRWGQLIYESNDIDEGWDGMYQNKLAPQAVYVFKASGKYTNGREFQETGSILLIR